MTRKQKQMVEDMKNDVGHVLLWTMLFSNMEDCKHYQSLIELIKLRTERVNQTLDKMHIYDED